MCFSGIKTTTRNIRSASSDCNRWMGMVIRGGRWWILRWRGEKHCFFTEFRALVLVTLSVVIHMLFPFSVENITLSQRWSNVHKSFLCWSLMTMTVAAACDRHRLFHLKCLHCIISYSQFHSLLLSVSFRAYSVFIIDVFFCPIFFVRCHSHISCVRML